MKRDYVTNVRVNREEKEQVDEILDSIGLNFSAVITLLMKQIILSKGVPFPVVMPQEEDTVKEIHTATAAEPLLGIEEKGTVMKEVVSEEREVDNTVLDENLHSDEDIAADTAGEELTLQEDIVVSNKEDAGEELFIEQSRDVDFESMTDSVSNLETLFEDGRDDENDDVSFSGANNMPVESTMRASVDHNHSDEDEDKAEDFTSIFDAFQSMNI